jgi:hypothetical protein
MWKEFLGKLIQSCMYMDPIAYMHYAAAMRQRSEQVSTAKDEADERELIRLVERLEIRAREGLPTSDVIQFSSHERRATGAG